MEQLGSKGKPNLLLPRSVLYLKTPREHDLFKYRFEGFQSKIVQLFLAFEKNLNQNGLIPFYNINYNKLIITAARIMDTDYFLDTVQWIFVSMEFASMLLFSFVMYGYCKNNKR